MPIYPTLSLPSGSAYQTLQYNSAAVLIAADAKDVSGTTRVIPAGTDLIQSIVEDNPGVYYLEEGTHIINSAIDASKLSGVKLRGYGFGRTIIQRASDVSFLSNSLASPTPYNCGNTTANSYKVTTSTASDAGNFSVGDTVVIKGTYSSVEFQILDTVVSANNSTGEINLVHNFPEIFTSVTIAKFNPVITDFEMSGISFDSNGQSSIGFDLYHLQDCDIDLKFFGQDTQYCNMGRFSYVKNSKIHCHAPERAVNRPGSGSGLWDWNFNIVQGGDLFAEVHNNGTITNSPFSSSIYLIDCWRCKAYGIAEGGNVGLNCQKGGYCIVDGQVQDCYDFGFHMYKNIRFSLAGHARDCGTNIANNGATYVSNQVNS